MRRLLDMAGDCKAVYLMAAHTGLRRSEIAALKWSDLLLDAVTPFVQVRASTTKNGKPAAMRLLPEVAAALASSKERNAGNGKSRFLNGCRALNGSQRDLKKAGIRYQDANGTLRRIFIPAEDLRDKPRAKRVCQPRCNGTHAAQ